MKKFVLYSDGACSGNPGPGGWGAVLFDVGNDLVQELGAAEPATTNNRMEMMACLEGLQKIALILKPLQKSETKVQLATDIFVYTDSTYLIYGATQWSKGWKARGWKNAKGETISNPDLWQDIDQVLNLLRNDLHSKIHWSYVPGHEGIDGNERCDEIAVGFSKGDHVYLYRGSSAEYHFDITQPPKEFPLPEMKFDRGAAKANAADNFYLSSVGGIVYRHKTWASCERRVKGVAAKFKKLKSESEVSEVLKGWGIAAGTSIKDSE